MEIPQRGTKTLEFSIGYQPLKIGIGRIKHFLKSPLLTSTLIFLFYLHISELFLGVTADEQFTFGHVLLMQVADIVLYALLTWYIEGIFPGEYGIAKKFYFPFSRKYWCSIQHQVSIGFLKVTYNPRKVKMFKPFYLPLSLSLKVMSI